MLEQQTYPRKQRKKTEMVPLKLACLLLVLLVTVRHSIAYPQQDENAAIEHNAVLTRKEPADGILTAADARNRRIRGRKMAVNKVAKPEKVNKSGAIGGTSKISSAITHLDEKFEHEGKGVSNVKCKQSVESLLPQEVDAAGFVAFSADYHSPRHHPPKNN